VEFDAAVRNALITSSKGLYLETRLGWLAHENNSSLPGPKYLTSFNFARFPLELDYIRQFSRSSNSEAIKTLYSQCNGMRVLNDLFVVPGVGFHTSDMHGLEFFNVPYDFQVCRGLDGPAKAPVDGLIVGISRQNDEAQNGDLFDIVDERGRIVSGCFDNSPSVIEVENDYLTWISSRVSQAEQTYMHALRRKMN